MKDWTGTKYSIYNCIGASNHTKSERTAYDYYATDPKAAELLLVVEPSLNNIWEPACGEGHLADVFAKAGRLWFASDIVNRGYELQKGCLDFLKYEENQDLRNDIVTNPPYKYAKEFVEKALEIVQNDRKVCMFLKLTFLEGKARKELFKKNPPQTVYVFSERIACGKNGKFSVYDIEKNKDIPVSSAVAYAWFVWKKGYKGKTIIKWIN